jgi:hypothetical protein
MFLTKMGEKGGVTVDYLAELLRTNTDEDWRLERNGRISELLLNGVRAELGKRVNFNDDASKVSISPIKLMSLEHQNTRIRARRNICHGGGCPKCYR